MLESTFSQYLGIDVTYTCAQDRSYTKAAGYGEDTAHFFIKDADHPYLQEKPFDWIRGYQVGGKSLIWGRACQRWREYEFKAPKKYRYGLEWPIGYDDSAPWYFHFVQFCCSCINGGVVKAIAVRYC